MAPFINTKRVYTCNFVFSKISKSPIARHSLWEFNEKISDGNRMIAIFVLPETDKYKDALQVLTDTKDDG